MDIFSFLEQKLIRHERYNHPAVFTVEEAIRLIPELPAVSTKNLFLRDKRGKIHILVIVERSKRVNIKTLEKQLNINHLSFASAERLHKYLGIQPGSVSLLALINDPDHLVKVVIDEDLWSSEAMAFHPLINTATLVIPTADIKKFLQYTGHSYISIRI